MIMAPSHRRWDEFVVRLESALTANHEGDGWGCDHDLALSALVLAVMRVDDDDVHATLDFFKSQGGHCDCEVMFNIAIPDEVDLPLPREERDRLNHKRNGRGLKEPAAPNDNDIDKENAK
jgi:hypothetical protein